jgi:hypothetical protein
MNFGMQLAKVVIVIGRCSKSENHHSKNLANFGYESANF